MSNVLTSFTCSYNYVYANLERKLSGVNYKAIQNNVYFFYDEEYYSTTGLSYKVYSSTSHSVVMNSSSQPLTSHVYGDNRYMLNVSALSTGTFILEVTNEKKEQFYLRFTK